MQIMRKNSKKWQIFTKKIGLKTHLWWVFGHVWTKFFMLVNFSPTLSTYYTFLGQKYTIDFSPDFSHFSPPGRLLKAVESPWKCFLRVPWLKTFHLGPRKPPKPLLAKNIFNPQIPKSQSQPSVYWFSIDRRQEGELNTTLQYFLTNFGINIG